MIMIIVSASGFSMENSDKKTAMDWKVGFNKEKAALPESWFEASVPGAVQIDYAKANNWPPFYYAENWKEYLWMEDVFWTYKTSFPKPELMPGEATVFYVERN